MNNTSSNQPLQKTSKDKQKSQTTKWVIIAEILFLLCAMGALVFFLYPHQAKEKNIQEDVAFKQAQAEASAVGQRMLAAYNAEVIPLSSPKEKEQLADTNSVKVTPTGVVFVTGNKVQGGDTQTQLFTFDIASPVNTPTPFGIKSPLNAMVEFKDIKNPTDYFFLATSPYSLENESDKSGIHLYTAVDKKIVPLVTTGSVMERSLDWSPTAKLLAFNRVKKDINSYVDLLPLENWEVVILDTTSQGILKVIPNAYQPKWFPDGTKLVYLKADGLYVYDYKAAEEKKIGSVSAGGEVVATSMMDLAPDGKTIVWTTAKSGVITLKQVVSWDTLEVVDIGQIKVPETEFYGPQFSPDGQFYVLQAIDTLKNGDTERKNPRLEIRSIKAKEVVKSISLTDFFFDAFFTDDWIAKMPVK